MIVTLLPVMTLAGAGMLAGCALVLAFFRRMPAVAVAYAAMGVSAAGGLLTFSRGQFLFWGVATVIALIIQYMTASGGTSRGRYCYTVGGALVGALVGLALSTEAAVIVASAAGAFLGNRARGMTPAGRRDTPPARFIDDFASTALPAVVNFSILMLILAQMINLQ